jgi:hypothetical protein
MESARYRADKAESAVRKSRGNRECMRSCLR